MKYLYRVGIQTSILFNVILGGHANQSFSARNHQWKRDGKFNLCWLINKMFWLDYDHCLTCWSYWYVIKTKVGK
jgi:hypothetical protein